ncbi:MAG: DUF3015 family protein [Thermodesulfobacteriota bacterium]|nr:DUF3015 family protein [Thermodesulfobacteriota bacterium]
MKKIIVSILACMLIVSMVSVASANTVREDCGCGLGGMAIGEEQGVVWKLVGTFLNGICGNQTFAMSSGTLDCGRDPFTAKYEKMNVFVADNMDTLAVDIARGEGESLDALAEIAEVSQEKRPALFAAMQRDFNQIYPDTQVTNEDVVNEITRIMQTI